MNILEHLRIGVIFVFITAIVTIAVSLAVSAFKIAFMGGLCG